MTPGRSVDADEVAVRDWPDYDLSPTYNPSFLPSSVSIDTDEVVIYDATAKGGESERWISANRAGHVSLPDCR